MPEGFEKQVPAAGLNDLLAFLTQPRQVSAARPEQGGHDRQHARHVRKTPIPSPSAWSFADWSPKIVEGVPFVLVDPKGDQVPNVVLLYGPQGKFPPLMPRSVELACNVEREGDPLPERRQRLGLSLRPQGERFADRAAPLRRRHGRGSPAGKWRPLRRLHPGRRRPRLEARLHSSASSRSAISASSPSGKTRSTASSWSRARTNRRLWSWP